MKNAGKNENCKTRKRSLFNEPREPRPACSVNPAQMALHGKSIILSDAVVESEIIQLILISVYWMLYKCTWTLYTIFLLINDCNGRVKVLILYKTIMFQLLEMIRKWRSSGIDLLHFYETKTQRGTVYNWSWGINVSHTEKNGDLLVLCHKTSGL